MVIAGISQRVVGIIVRFFVHVWFSDGLKGPYQNNISTAETSDSTKGKLLLRAVDSNGKDTAATCIVAGVAVFPPYEGLLSVGDVTIICRMEDHFDGVQRVTIRDDEPATITLEMKLNIGTVRIQLVDENDSLIAGRCSFDGDPLDVAANGSTTRLHLPARRTTKVICEAKDFEAVGRDIEIEGGSFQVLRIGLHSKKQ